MIEKDSSACLPECTEQYFCRLFVEIADSFSGTLFVQLIGGVIFMSTSIFQMEMVRLWKIQSFHNHWYNFCANLQALRNPNIYFLTVLNVLVTSVANLYLYCFAGAIISNNCLLFADALFESNWHRMPKTFQKYFIIMIAETQRPIYLEGYGIIRISLEAFTKVSKQ